MTSRPAPLPRGLHDRLEAGCRRFGITGLAVALVAPGREPMADAVGITTGPAPRSVDIDTPFYTASSGKHLTAMAVVSLAEDGRLALDDPIGRHLPELPSAWGDRSIGSLLHHTSGLPEYLAYTDGESVPATRAGFVAAYRHLEPPFAEDEAWSYSNTNYILLGLLVAAVAGEPFAHALEHRLLREAAGDGLGIGGPAWAAALVERHAGPAPWGRAPDAAMVEIAGDGDLVASASGLLRWHAALSGGVLGADARARMVEPRRLRSGRVAPYGAGWFVDSVGGHACHHHAGHYDGWTAFFYRAPDAAAAVYLTSNVALGHTRLQRFLALDLLEACAPGSTPLGLAVPPRDGDPALTRLARKALLRDGAPADPDDFAPELRLVADRVSGVRGLLDLSGGGEPASFTCVEERDDGASRFRRYRLAHADRTEHVLCGHAPDGRLHWAWPV